MKSLTITPLAEHRDKVEAFGLSQKNLESRVQALEGQKVTLETQVRNLESRRTEIINGIARGTASDADLAKVRKELSKTQDSLTDAIEILGATQFALGAAEKDLQKAQADLKAEEKRVWRGIGKSLVERHKNEIEATLNKLYVCQTLGNDNPFESIGIPSAIAAFQFALPAFNKPESIAAIKAELSAEFGV